VADKITAAGAAADSRRWRCQLCACRSAWRLKAHACSRSSSSSQQHLLLLFESLPLQVLLQNSCERGGSALGPVTLLLLRRRRLHPLLLRYDLCRIVRPLLLPLLNHLLLLLLLLLACGLQCQRCLHLCRAPHAPALGSDDWEAAGGVVRPSRRPSPARRCCCSGTGCWLLR
jgi:hypothetical protein